MILPSIMTFMIYAFGNKVILAFINFLYKKYINNAPNNIAQNLEKKINISITIVHPKSKLYTILLPKPSSYLLITFPFANMVNNVTSFW